jgi:hypothetical protein
MYERFQALLAPRKEREQAAGVKEHSSCGDGDATHMIFVIDRRFEGKRSAGTSGSALEKSKLRS